MTPFGDADELRTRINKLRALLGIREIAIDPENATHLSTQLQADGFEVVTLSQGFTGTSHSARGRASR